MQPSPFARRWDRPVALGLTAYVTVQICAHAFFDELRLPTAALPNGKPQPALFNFKSTEMQAAGPLINKLIPPHVAQQRK